MKKFFTLWFTACILLNASAQEPNKDWFKEFRTIIPGKHYEANWFHELFFGAHWRDVWAAPVRIGVIDMEKYGEGLTPIEKGGGLQTKALKFNGKDGKTYKFRSLDKDPEKTLPVELRQSIARDIMKDQICSSNPYAGFVVNPILDSVGVSHAEFTLVILPDDPALGEFRREFANLAGIMEIVPEEGQFEGSDRVVSSVKLLDRLNSEFDESVDEYAFLKARLMDIYFGDWDRHKDQWKWIRFDDGDKKFYKPFPMDRDQAFDKLDGFFPFLATQYVNQLSNFGYDYPKMRFMAWSGRYLDQRFLAFLSKRAWDDVTDEVSVKLTDQLIENAVRKLPPEVYSIAKDELLEKLKSRRDQFKEASTEYYEHVNSIVDIYTTDKDDFVKIGFNPITGIDLTVEDKGKDFTMITIFKREEGAGERKSDVLRQKMFDNSITGEIRIYLQGGDDEVVLGGKGADIPTIRIIGGDGKDIVRNNSDEIIYFYDDGKRSKVSGDICRDDDKFRLPHEEATKVFERKKETLSEEKKGEYETLIGNLRYDPVVPPDKFYLTELFPLFNFSPDIGPFFGATLNYLKYGFRMNPYIYKLQFTLGYALEKKGIKGLVADFDSDFRGIVKHSGINLHVRKSGIEINNFFNMGNNSAFSDSLSEAKYYMIENEKYSGELGITFPVDNKLRFNIGLQFTHFRIEAKENNISRSISFASASKQKLNLGRITGGIEFDGRDHPSAPFKGYYFNISGSYTPKVFNDFYRFGRVTGDLRGYIEYKTTISLALRAWGEKVIGDKFPFFESAFLGGTKYLRGYPSERFAGDGSLMGSTEVRLKLFDYNILLPQTLGIFGFGETGRVFLKNEVSKKWHACYGGGLFIHLINRDFTVRLTYAGSSEKVHLIYFGTGFSF